MMVWMLHSPTTFHHLISTGFYHIHRYLKFGPTIIWMLGVLDMNLKYNDCMWLMNFVLMNASMMVWMFHSLTVTQNTISTRIHPIHRYLNMCQNIDFIFWALQIELRYKDCPFVIFNASMDEKRMILILHTLTVSHNTISTDIHRI